MAKKNSRDGDRIIIKKYANRRLYNTDSSSYVTLDDLAVMVKDGTDFVVRDAKSGEDITHSVLTQIIFEEESKGETMLPVNFLRQLISFYGDGLQKVVPDYLESSMSAFAENQEKFRDFFTGTLPGADLANPALKPFEEMARQNMAIFEQTMSMFSPFGASRGAAEGKAADKKAEESEAQPEQGTASSTGVDGDPLSDLQAQLAAMQDQINKLQKNNK
ncbi:polyhydroxyalkanoate synthesis repressor PhaR [Paremcibacter congregatus]|uniref:Polyhydroxyalkanoate synthesis repressor PhaR n=1 Tax=Paremcibacter congregatus TaxID=2043170 RepID=A0A2G4YT53_9PROT|nr:polyhydroxyalkanoate synthesis repressor PhaR [Paremcibacter congregatus]PHZ85522.1 polyhydroxyalkanoate synthesis repressor PhaR [Paremcibacter congregatus]QDE26480.1 polyhydroxyalkanoate synthesis repressor PhaR [Paremcibacter congregatus]